MNELKLIKLKSLLGQEAKYILCIIASDKL